LFQKKSKQKKKETHPPKSYWGTGGGVGKKVRGSHLARAPMALGNGKSGVEGVKPGW